MRVSIRSRCSAARFSCVVKSSRCGAVRILNADCEPSRCFRRVPALARGASCEFGLELTTLSLCFVRGSAGACSVLRIVLIVVDGRLASAAAWSVLRIPFGSVDPLLVLGG